MIRLKLIPALLGATALTACAVGPNYQVPAPAASGQGAFISAEPAIAAADAPPGDWWRLFQDPTLDGLVQEALVANKDVAVAAANLSRVRAVLSETRSGLLPSTTISASGQRVRGQDVVTGQFAEGDQYRAGFDMSYEVDLFGRVRRSLEANRADVAAAQAALDVVRVSVAAETARAYADICAANAQIAVTKRTIELQQNTYDLTARQLEAGRGTAADTSAAATQLETSKAVLPSLDAQRSAALFRLALLTGKTPAEAPQAVLSCQATPQVAQAIPVGDGAGMLARRPDVRQAERDLAAATARIGVATASLYPSVTIGGGIATTGARSGDLGDDYTFNVGPLINWNFPNILAARARVKQAGAGAEAALATFEKVNLTALQETETALTQYARELDRRAALKRARDEGETAARLARLRNEAGVDSLLAVLVAERQLASLEAQLAQSDAQVTTNQIALFKALGGGWEAAGE
ncbi:MAG: RND transporter [Phenylobacterium sp.]|uniref:efflux transporter outer membrane subunit n=1 Tax=Phenylobacterium sp. TaxID=1871053 RepID=UPI0025E90A3F|nr:TolC family protein [Phenylobacterium sp.]MBA4014104.1 RND transporter [Phenylobacterium sp.]